MLRAKLTRDFTAHETALWTEGDDEVVFQAGDYGETWVDQDGDLVFHPDGYMSFIFGVTEDDIILVPAPKQQRLKGF